MRTFVWIVILYILLLLSAACTTRSLEPTATPTADVVARGSEVYARACAECHGEEGEGHAYPPAPALNGSEHAWHHPDAQIREWIKTGKVGMAEMPAYGDRLSDAEIDAVLVYIKSLWSEEQRTFQEDISERYPTATP